MHEISGVRIWAASTKRNSMRAFSKLAPGTNDRKWAG